MGVSLHDPSLSPFLSPSLLFPKMWTNVMGPMAVPTAVKTSQGATAVPVPRASPLTRTGANVWVSGRGEHTALPTAVPMRAM